MARKIGEVTLAANTTIVATLKNTAGKGAQSVKELADMDLTANTDGGVLVHNPTTGKFVLQPYKFDGGDF